MGCCCSKGHRGKKDGKSPKRKADEVPMEWNKDPEKFPEKTQSTQYSGERMMPSSDVAGSREPIHMHKQKSKEKHSAEGLKLKEKKHEATKQHREQKRHSVRAPLSTREYQQWREKVRDVYPEETQNTQNSENIESGKSAKSLSEKHSSEKGIKGSLHNHSQTLAEHLGPKSPLDGDDSLRLHSETGGDSSMMSLKTSKSVAG